MSNSSRGFRRRNILSACEGAEMTLTLADEEAMVLDTAIERSHPTARVQVNVTFKDENGVAYHATGSVKVRVKREEGRQ
jgi:hypothetical protein